MEVFKRIDRLRRLARDAAGAVPSAGLMAGCARVRSPIQRTNLMMKDPGLPGVLQAVAVHGRAMTSVGYTIEERDAALEFDEEYLLADVYQPDHQATLCLRACLESDPRSMREIAEEHREPVKPKFIKEIKEEIVEDRDIPDVEIRKVFVEEVTQAQIEAEEKLQKEIGQREELERTVSDLNGQVDSLNDQMGYLEQQLVDANMQLDLLRQQLEESQTALAAAGEATRQAKEQAKEAEENLILIHQEAKEEVEVAKKEAEEAAAAARQGAAQEIKATREKAQQELEAVQKAAQEAREKAAAELAAAQAAAKKSAQAQVEKARREADAVLEKVRRESGQAMEKLRREADSAIAKARNEARTAKNQLKELEEEKAGLEAQLKKMEKTLASNRLSRYLVNSLKERRDRKHSKEGGS